MNGRDAWQKCMLQAVKCGWIMSIAVGVVGVDAFGTKGNLPITVFYNNLPFMCLEMFRC
jgi:nitric oxide reductase large subunit